MRQIGALVLSLVIVTTSLTAGCSSSGSAHHAGEPKPSAPSGRSATELVELKFSNGLNNVTAHAEFLDDEPGGVSMFDPVICNPIEHGKSCTVKNFKSGGKPAHPKPTRIVLAAGGGAHNPPQLTITASSGHFIASVNAGWNDPDYLSASAYNDDGTPATVK